MDGGPDDPEHFPDDLPEQHVLQVTGSQLWAAAVRWGHATTLAATHAPPPPTAAAHSARQLRSSAPQVDQGLTPLQAVMEWAAEGNPPAQRVAYILSIPAAAAESSLEEARAVLLPLLSQLAFDDHPDVKQATAEVLGPLGELNSEMQRAGRGQGRGAEALADAGPCAVLGSAGRHQQRSRRQPAPAPAGITLLPILPARLSCPLCPPALPCPSVPCSLHCCRPHPGFQGCRGRGGRGQR